MGYLECGGDDAELFWGSVVEVTEDKARDGIRRWRLYEEQVNGTWKVLPEDKSIAVRGPRHVIHVKDVKRHLKQRRPVISVNGPTCCNTGFGEGPEGPGKILILDNELGLDVVRRFSGSELWRLGEDPQENLDLFNKVNPGATDADRARAAGDGITRRYAVAVVTRMMSRLRAYLSAKQRKAKTVAAIRVQMVWRGRRARRSGQVPSGAGLEQGVTVSRTAARQSRRVTFADEVGAGITDVSNSRVMEAAGLLARSTAARDPTPSLCYVCARPNGGVRSPGGEWVCCMKCPQSGGRKHTQGCDDRCRIGVNEPRMCGSGESCDRIVGFHRHGSPVSPR